MKLIGIETNGAYDLLNDHEMFAGGVGAYRTKDVHPGDKLLTTAFLYLHFPKNENCGFYPVAAKYHQKFPIKLFKQI